MKKIIIIDDEQDILRILERFLGRKFDVTVFSDPVAGLNAIKNGNYDLLLTDIMMPQLDGLSLLKKLRESNNSIKVIMMTAFDSLDKALEAHSYGAKNYIKKPFTSLEDVQNTILAELV
ncbi:MAG: response regulator [Arcobacter sp.]|nr:response regulator [Arcobacter sp.]